MNIKDSETINEKSGLTRTCKKCQEVRSLDDDFQRHGQGYAFKPLPPGSNRRLVCDFCKIEVRAKGLEKNKVRIKAKRKIYYSINKVEIQVKRIRKELEKKEKEPPKEPPKPKEPKRKNIKGGYTLYATLPKVDQLKIACRLQMVPKGKDSVVRYKRRIRDDISSQIGICQNTIKRWYDKGYTLDISHLSEEEIQNITNEDECTLSFYEEGRRPAHYTDQDVSISIAKASMNRKCNPEELYVNDLE